MSTWLLPRVHQALRFQRFYIDYPFFSSVVEGAYSIPRCCMLGLQVNGQILVRPSNGQRCPTVFIFRVRVFLRVFIVLVRCVFVFFFVFLIVLVRCVFTFFFMLFFVLV